MSHGRVGRSTETTPEVRVEVKFDLGDHARAIQLLADVKAQVEAAIREGVRNGEKEDG